MVYAAFEWDHVVGNDYIRWVVIECAGIGELFGGIQALPPRVDAAYFIDPQTAEADAVAFAKMKNGGATGVAPQPDPAPDGERFEAFCWDHRQGKELIRWAVLKHLPALAGTKRNRRDVAYFLQESAEEDAKSFAKHRNALLLERAS